MDKTGEFTHINQCLKPILNIEGNNYLYFGGTAYLGMPQNQELINNYIKGIRIYGLNNGTSRANNVQLDIYDKAEHYLANQYGVEAAMLSSSGYLASSLTVSTFKNYGVLRYAPQCHPSLWINENQELTGDDFEQWASKLHVEIENSDEDNWVLISNSINNLYPQRYDFNFIGHLPKSKNILLIIDDSHGLGILNNGTSILKSIPQSDNIKVLIVASMAKGLGIDAGVILGGKDIIAELKSTNMFYGASPASAAGLYAYMQSAEVYKQAFKKLCSNMSFMQSQINNKAEDWVYIDEFPVYLIKKPNVEKLLLTNKILISSFPYPDQNGEVLNRIVLSSWHQQEQIEKLLTVINYQ